MLDKKELQEYTGTFNIYQVEKDYLQHLALSYLYKTVRHPPVFKGGTALQKCYGLDRFSEDLDFTGSVQADALGSVCSELTRSGFESFSYAVSENEFSFSAKLRIRGPLYDGKEISECTISFEASKREAVLLPPKPVQIVPPYTDLLPYAVFVMQPQEILAEKVRSVLERDKARDVYDLWFLLRKGASPERKLIESKIRGDFHESAFRDAIMKKQARWQDLKNYVLHEVDFAETSGYILASFGILTG